MIESQPMAEFVGEQRFEVVRTLALRGGERCRSGEASLAVIAEERIGIENLSHELRARGRADGRADRVCGDGAGERQNAAGKSVARLVEANCVQAIDIVFGVVGAGILGGDTSERRAEAGICGGVEGGAGNAGPCAEGIGDGLLDFSESQVTAEFVEPVTLA
jgi:hypothetical protein